MSLKTVSNNKYSVRTFAAGRNNISVTPNDTNWASVALLLHGDGTNNQNNATIVDSSTNNYTVSRNGNPSQGSFNPFIIPQYTAYSQATYTGSCYFSGSDNIRISTTGITNWSTSFTVECWVYLLAYPGAGVYGHILFGTSFSFGWLNNQVYITNNVATTAGSSANAVPLNTWTHLACVVTSNSTKVYANGVQIVSSGTGYTTYASNSVTTIGGNNASAQYLNGYISNLRVTNSEVYTGAFSPPTAPLSTISGTSLLLKFANAAIYDSSVKNNLLINADTKTMVAINKFGGSSIYFDGTGDYISTLSGAIGNFGSANFTIEFWWNNNSVSQTNYASVISHAFTGSPVTGCYALKIKTTTDIIQFTYHNGSGLTDANGTVNVNDGVWHHIAMVRSGTTLYVFVDGVADITVSVSTNVLGVASTQTFIGYQARDGAYINGYIDDLRITNNVARYTSTFSVPTAAYPDF